MMFRMYQRILLFLLCLLLLGGCGKTNKERKTGSATPLSPKAMMAKYFVDNELPDDFKSKFYSGMWMFDENFVTYLVNAGHLEGAIEYSESLRKKK